MNPSAAGWIDKFFHRLTEDDLLSRFNNLDDFYHALRASGFIYGYSTNGLTHKQLSELELSKNELNKINLIHSLYYIFRTQKSGKNDIKAFLEDVLTFYNDLERGKVGFLQRLTLDSSQSKSLEKVLTARIQESDSTLSKDAKFEFSNFLLATDVLAYLVYDQKHKASRIFLDALEAEIINDCHRALESKATKTERDKSLIVLFKSSGLINPDSTEPLSTFLNKRDDKIVQKYLLDLCCVTVKEDLKVEAGELKFINSLAIELGLNKDEGTIALKELEKFMDEKDDFIDVSLFNQSHPIQHFYDRSTKKLEKLIMRNKSRLAKELNESGELLILLGQSTVRDLNESEKEKVKEQLLDVFKSIPSLTIFMLPGGSLLLPFFMKYLPKLLPSAFQDNEIKDKETKNKK